APQPAPAPLRVLLRDALASRRIDGQIRVEEELPADLPLLYVDVVQVRQALAHLLANAIEAMPEGGTLRVRAFACDAGVAVQIEDTGVGIPSEHRDRLFEPLFTTKPRGAGLGLALVQRVVAAHHGTIRIESEDGQGTTVTLLLPAAER
ncbi:MAG TPA: ATP-binding protein, partial [Armatimonadota bacterium]|nr:ATP-binding protein [Armatimonadota bacterium]